MAVTCGAWRDRLRWLTNHLDEPWQGKDYEYIARKIDNHFEIFRRHTEMDKWELYTYAVIVDDRFYVNNQGVNNRCERYYKQCRSYN